MIFVERNYNPLLVNLVKAPAAGGAGLDRNWPPWMRIKVFPGQAAAGPSQHYEEISSISAPAEMAARLRCELLIKNLTLHYNCQFCLCFNFILIRNPSDASKCVQMGCKNNFILFKNVLVWLFIITWSSLHEMYVEETCRSYSIVGRHPCTNW